MRELKRAPTQREVGLGDFHSRGAFFTPPAVASFLAEWAIRDAGDVVLEPTCGEAAFLRPVVDTLRARGADDAAVGRQVWGFDIDPATVEHAEAVLADMGVQAQIRRGDFFNLPTPDQLGGDVPYVQAVVGNPPFVRYQLFSGASRSASQRAALAHGVRLSGLASSWAASLIHASGFLAPEGRIAMVLPAELLTVGYAEPVRRFLYRRFGRVNLVLFEKLVFESALENVVLLLAEGAGGCDHFDLHHVADEADLERALPEPLRVRPEAGKWTGLMFLSPEVRDFYATQVARHFEPLETYGAPRLGVVTGSNRFFALRPSTVRRLGLDEDDLAPISPPGTRHLRGLAFTAADWEDLAERDEPVYLLRLHGPIPVDHPAAPLVAEGERTGVADAYKCRIRNPWYVVPPVVVPDLFFTYMSHRFPRLIDNRVGAGFVNSMHGVQLQTHRRLARSALPLASLNSLTLLGAELVGRAYGGGVLKLEPREAAVMPVLRPEVLEAAWDRLRPHKARLDSQLRRAGWPRVVADVDEIVLEGTLGLSREERILVQQTADVLRTRRTSRKR